jgi:hypothetical protein
MEHKVASENSINEVLRKIGRNMMLFQQFEYLLKFIVTNGKLSGNASELERLKSEQAAIINKQTMGLLVGQYIENSNPDYEEYSSDPEEIKEAFISFSFRIKCDSIRYETKKEVLAGMISERNELIHHLLPCFDAKSAESCEELGNKLDDQSENIRSEIKELKAVANALNDGRKQLASFLGSEEGKKQFELSLLRQSRLVVLLGDIAVQTGRPDGWALMSVAGQLVKQHAPEEIALLKERYGYKSLKTLILATEIFDVYEEATEKCGVRVLYRLKSGWELSNANKAAQVTINGNVITVQ